MKAQDYASIAKTTHKLELNDTAGCSGTAIGPHALLTAAHCLDPHNDIDIDPGMKSGAWRKVISVLTGELEHEDEKLTIVSIELDNYDHAILFLSGITFQDYAEFAPNLPKMGDDVFIIGNPMDFVEILRKGYYVGEREDDPKYFIDLNGFFGDSGAAIFNKQGQIISVTSVLANRAVAGATMKLVGFNALHFTDEQLKHAREWQP